MKVLVSGSRHFNDVELLDRVMGDIWGERGITEIIHGKARGADTLAGEWAEFYDIPVKEFSADWNKHGRSAGPIRNRQMLKEGEPDLVVAFLAPNSRGTADMIKAATEAGVEVKVINID